MRQEGTPGGVTLLPTRRRLTLVTAAAARLLGTRTTCSRRFARASGVPSPSGASARQRGAQTKPPQELQLQPVRRRQVRRQQPRRPLKRRTNALHFSAWSVCRSRQTRARPPSLLAPWSDIFTSALSAHAASALRTTAPMAMGPKLDGAVRCICFSTALPSRTCPRSCAAASIPRNAGGTARPLVRVITSPEMHGTPCATAAIGAPSAGPLTPRLLRGVTTAMRQVGAGACSSSPCCSRETTWLRSRLAALCGSLRRIVPSPSGSFDGPTTPCTIAVSISACVQVWARASRWAQGQRAPPIPPPLLPHLRPPTVSPPVPPPPGLLSSLAGAPSHVPMGGPLDSLSSSIAGPVLAASGAMEQMPLNATFSSLRDLRCTAAAPPPSTARSTAFAASRRA